MAQERGAAPSLTVPALHVAPEADGTMLLPVGGQDGGPPGLDIARIMRAERVTGTPAEDVMGGGAGIFVPGRGRDRVKGFTPGEDRLLVDGEPRQVRTFFVEQDGREVLVVLHVYAGDYAGAAEQFGVWVRSGGADSPGLIARRASERRLFEFPVGTAGAVP